jgi:hypothetical protein
MVAEIRPNYPTEWAAMKAVAARILTPEAPSAVRMAAATRWTGVIDAVRTLGGVSNTSGKWAVGITSVCRDARAG